MVRNVSRYGYLIAAVVFVLGVLAQVFFVGLSLLGGRPSWGAHIALGHSLLLVALLLVLLAYLGRMERPVKPLTWVNLVVYLLLADFVVFLRGVAPFAAALHPVLALILFAVAAMLVSRAWRAVRSPKLEASRARAGRMVQETAAE